MEAIYVAAKERSPEQTVSNFHYDPTSENIMKQFSFRNIGGKIVSQSATPLTFRGDTSLMQFAKEGSINRSLLNYAALSADALQERLVTGAEFLLEYNFAADRSSDAYATIDVKDRFMKHYANTKDLLLAGPPNANHHDINPERAAAWVAAQLTEERRRLAQLVINVLRYISHAELIAGIQNCITQLEAQYDRDLPIIFIVGSPKKSNYFVSLLFTHFWLERGNRIDYVIPALYKPVEFRITGNIIDIDDMGYSGSQTTSNMNGFFKSVATILTKSMLGKITDSTILSFLPRFMVEYALGQIGLQYYLVRIFSSTESLNMWRTQVHLPHRFITHENIPTLRERVGKQDANRINAVFNMANSTMAVYFDHKVADAVSTLLVPIAYGIVPGKKAMIDQHNINLNLTAENKDKISASEGPDMPTFLPFINNCIRTLTVDDIDDYENDDIRCPFAWYKKIDYNKGTYMGHGGSRSRSRSRRYRKATHKRRQRRQNTHKRYYA